MPGELTENPAATVDRLACAGQTLEKETDMLLQSQMKQIWCGPGGKESDLNDPLWWDRVGPALYHRMRATARLGQQAATAGTFDAPSPRFNRDAWTYANFREEWIRMRYPLIAYRTTRKH